MKRFKMTSLPLLCAAVAPLCADSGMMRSGSSNSNLSEQQQQQKYMQEMNKITPTAEPAVSRCADPYGTADFIWWKAQEDGLDYVIDGIGDGVATLGRGHVHHPRFNYEPGFKVGGGLKFRHDGWDMFAQYTYLRHDKSRTFNTATSPGVGVVQTNIESPDGRGALTTYEVFGSTYSKWNLHLNVLDLELARNFWISKWLTLRPFTGMKFSWNPQKFHTTYNEITAVGGSTLDMYMKVNQWAIGMRSGLNMAFYMTKMFALVGDFAISGLWNRYKSTREDTQLAAGATAEAYYLNARKKDHRVTTVLEWDLGVRFESAWHNDDYLFQLLVAWEEQVWFGQNQFLMVPTNGAADDLTFQGLTVKVGLWF